MIKILGQIKDSKLPDIETERLYLRPRLVSDAEDIFAYASLPEVTWAAGFPPAESVEAEAYYLENIMPKRWVEQKVPSGYGICLKGKNKSLARLILISAMLMMFLKWAICFIQIIGVKDSYQKLRVRCWKLDLPYSISTKLKLNVMVTTKQANVLLKN